MRGELNRFAHYLKKVFKFHRLVRRLGDGRQNPKIPTHSVVLTLFFGAVMRVPSFFQLEKETLTASLATPGGLESSHQR